MSRAYRICVAEKSRRHIHVADGVCTDIEVLPILPPARLGEILSDELARRGFSVRDGTARRLDDGIAIEVDLSTARVTLRIEREEVREETAERTVRTASRVLEPQQSERIRADLRAEAEQKLDQEMARMQREVTDRLEQKLRDLRRELDEVSTRVAGTSLKEKARQLGEITELVEDETGSLTIRVKV